MSPQRQRTKEEETNLKNNAQNISKYNEVYIYSFKKLSEPQVGYHIQVHIIIKLLKIKYKGKTLKEKNNILRGKNKIDY